MAGSEFWFGRTKLEDARRAYDWHQGFASANAHIAKRQWKQFERLAKEWRVVAAMNPKGEPAGLVYFEQKKADWIIGGLAAAVEYRHLGVASVLIKLAVGFVLFQENPLSRRERVIGYVSSNNTDPRGLLKSLGFQYTKTVHGRRLPIQVDPDTPKLFRAKFDEFELTVPDTPRILSSWCKAWNGKLKGGATAKLDLGAEFSLDDWQIAFSKMARE